MFFYGGQKGITKLKLYRQKKRSNTSPSTYNNEIGGSIIVRVRQTRRQATPCDNTIRRILHQRNAEHRIDRPLHDSVGEERHILDCIPRGFVPYRAVVRTREGRIGEPENAHREVIPMPIRVVGKAGLLARDSYSAARNIRVTHRPRDVLARAVTQGKVKIINRALAEAWDTVEPEAAVGGTVLGALRIMAREAGLHSPGVGATRVEQKPYRDAVPPALDGVLGREGANSADVLVRVLATRRRCPEHAVQAGHGVAVATLGLDIGNSGYLRCVLVRGGLVASLGTLKGEAIQRLRDIPVGGRGMMLRYAGS